LIEALARVKNSFNSYPLDRLATVGGVAAFEDQAYFEHTCQAVMSSREGLMLSLEDLGFKVLPSQANFVFATHPAHDAVCLVGALRDRGVLVRHFKQARIDTYLRISVGTPAQCDQLISAMSAVLAEAV
jgi:histidinol-phosphate aminotransferase